LLERLTGAGTTDDIPGIDDDGGRDAMDEDDGGAVTPSGKK
jgi:hypothetical protein